MSTLISQNSTITTTIPIIPLSVALNLTTSAVLESNATINNNITNNNITNNITNHISDNITNNLTEIISQTLNASDKFSITDPLNILLSSAEDANADFSLILLGYCCIFTLMSAWLFSTCFKPLGKASRFIFIFAKVLIVLAIETIILPILLGYLLDYWLNKEVFGLEWKIISIGIHWVFGLGYMFSFATLVGWLNKILRPGVLWFFRNPNDPDFDLLREIVNIPALRHVRRITMSILLYSFMISSFIGLPVTIARFVS